MFLFASRVSLTQFLIWLTHASARPNVYPNHFQWKPTLIKPLRSLLKGYVYLINYRTEMSMQNKRYIVNGDTSPANTTMKCKSSPTLLLTIMSRETASSRNGISYHQYRKISVPSFGYHELRFCQQLSQVMFEWSDSGSVIDETGRLQAIVTCTITPNDTGATSWILPNIVVDTSIETFDYSSDSNEC